MSEQLKHIFDPSACLSRRQMKDYVSGVMTKEECHALEHHLNSCFFCSEALEGMMEHEDVFAGTMDELDNSFLKDHFNLSNPQIHLNSLAPAAAVPVPHKKQRNRVWSQPVWKTTGIAAALLIALGWLYYKEFGSTSVPQSSLAVSSPSMATGQQPVNQEIVSSQDGDINMSSGATEAARQSLPEPERNGAQKVPPVIVTADKRGPDAMIANAAPSEQNSTQPADKDVSIAKAAGEVSEDQRALVLRRALKDDEGRKNEVAPSAPKTPVFSNNISSGPSAGAQYNQQTLGYSSAEGVERTVSEKKRARKEIADVPVSEQLYHSGKWSDALAAYKKEMSSPDKGTRQRATVMAAKCYLNLGQTKSARKLLETIVEEGGSQKRVAKRMLRQMEDPAEE
jgi:hypothetical protein